MPRHSEDLLAFAVTTGDLRKRRAAAVFDLSTLAVSALSQFSKIPAVIVYVKRVVS